MRIASGICPLRGKGWIKWTNVLIGELQRYMDFLIKVPSWFYTIGKMTLFSIIGNDVISALGNLLEMMKNHVAELFVLKKYHQRQELHLPNIFGSIFFKNQCKHEGNKIRQFVALLTLIINFGWFFSLLSRQSDKFRPSQPTHPPTYPLCSEIAGLMVRAY